MVVDIKEHRKEWSDMLQATSNIDAEVRELCQDIINDADEDSFEFWPDLKRQIVETIDGMWMPDCDFGMGERRQKLCDDVLLVLREIYAELKPRW